MIALLLAPQAWLFEDNRTHIEAGINLLAGHGASEIVLVGQSLGINRVLYYQAETPDPRVRGLDSWLEKISRS